MRKIVFSLNILMLIALPLGAGFITYIQLLNYGVENIWLRGSLSFMVAYLFFLFIWLAQKSYSQSDGLSASYSSYTESSSSLIDSEGGYCCADDSYSCDSSDSSCDD